MTNIIRLRSEFKTLKQYEVNDMQKEKGFFDYHNKYQKSFINQYESKTIFGDKIVIDYATGLMWQHGGSRNYMKFAEVQKWVEEENQKGFAGYSDWRLPTVEEGASILGSIERNPAIYTDRVFDKFQTDIWTGDIIGEYSGSSYMVSFFHGSVFSQDQNKNGFVRLVRFI